MYVCLCHAVTERTIRDVIRGGARSLGEIGRACRAGTDCGQCRASIELLLRESRQEIAGHSKELTGKGGQSGR